MLTSRPENAGGKNETFTVVGTVNARASALGPYGNCTWDTAARARPFRRELLDAVFTLVLEDFAILPASSDDDGSGGRASPQHGPRVTNTRPAEGFEITKAPSNDRTEYDAQEPTAGQFLHVILGRVYELTKRRITARDAIDFSPDDVLDSADPDGHLGALGKHWLRHNPAIPAFKASGERLGPTGHDLQLELFDGQHVRVEIEPRRVGAYNKAEIMHEFRVRRLVILDKCQDSFVDK